MSVPIAFILCTEGGVLEPESLLMVESFRKYTGKFKDAPLYSFQVREKNDVSAETIAKLTGFGVNHQKVVLNTKYPDYPLANKPLLCAYAERTIDADILVFLDSDLVFFSEPTEFLLPHGYDVGIRPEHHKMIGSEGTDDPNDAYWQRLYKIAGVTNPDRFVTTTVDRKQIRAFWNSGVVAVRRNAGVCTAWQQTIEQLLVAGAGITTENWYYEQSALSATICAINANVLHFSPSYNYPIHSHNQLSETGRYHNFDEIVCIHDHFFRDRREKYRERTWVKILKQMQDFDRQSEKYQWLYTYLQQHNAPPNLAQVCLETVLFLPLIRSLLPNRKR